MRFSPVLAVSAAVGILISVTAVLLPCEAQNYGDVTVRKNPDGSIETFDSSESMPAPSRRRSGYKKSTHRYNDGVVVRKNADGSIETFDSSDSVPLRSRGGSAKHSKSVHKYSDGVTVKRNPDGTIETFDSAPVGRSARAKSFTSSKPISKSKPGTSSSKQNALSKDSSSKSGVSARKTVRRTARKRANYGDVRVIRNPDGSIETYDAN